MIDILRLSTEQGVEFGEEKLDEKGPRDSDEGILIL